MNFPEMIVDDEGGGTGICLGEPSCAFQGLDSSLLGSREAEEASSLPRVKSELSWRGTAPEARVLLALACILIRRLK